MKIFVIEVDYFKDITGKYYARIWGRDENGKKVCILDEYEYYVWFLPNGNKKLEDVIKKISEHRKIKKIEVVNKKFLGKTYKAIKAYVNPSDIDDIREFAKKLKEEGWIDGKKEHDISYHRKFIIDKKIFPFNWYEFDGKEKRDLKFNVDKCYLLKNIQPAVGNREIKVLAFDIEVFSGEKGFPDPEKDPIISIAFYGKNFKKVVSWKSVKNAKSYYKIVGNEYELIKEFERTIKEYDPDILVGYNSNNFDLYYLYQRAKKYNIRFSFGWDRTGLTMTKKKGEDKRFKITGIPHIDLYTFIANILAGTLNTDTLTLNEVAREILGEEKIDLSWEDINQIWKEDRGVDRILEYNLRDAEITYKLAEKILPIIFELTRIVGQNIIDVAHMTYGQLVEWYLIRRTRDFNEIAPNRPKPEEVQRRKSISYAGAYVFEPRPGLYENIVVFDFRSLYPSIIILHNVSPDTLNCDHDRCHRENSIEIITTLGKKTVWFCKEAKGFIPTVLKEIFEERARLKRKLKELDKNSEEYKSIYSRQYALKILANSTYGYMGFPNSRWYCLECAAAITSWGRHYIKTVADEAKKWGFEVIYGDTDSIFLKAESKERALKFLEHINSLLKKPMELELEDFYIRGIFVSKKSDVLEGAKKKYALLSESGNIKLRGFETVRRDWAPIAKETQRKVIEIILKEGNVEKAIEYVRKVIRDLKEYKIPIEKLIIHEQLRKNLEEYKSEGPHVIAARKLKARGINVAAGFIVRYVICKGGERIRDKVRLPDECGPRDYDPEYYINHQIIPAIEKIFLALKVPKDRLISSGQTTLSAFFKK